LPLSGSGPLAFDGSSATSRHAHPRNIGNLLGEFEGAGDSNDYVFLSTFFDQTAL
jgi:hypothetical protein